jgi:hypothetical protein
LQIIAIYINTHSMKTFEEFVASREKIDPSTKSMAEHQWVQAYSAYCSSRERLRAGRQKARVKSGSEEKSKSSSSQHSRGMHRPSSISDTALLKTRIREQSAYSDLRVIIDVLAWVAIAVIIVIALLGIVAGFNFYSSLSALVVGGLNVLLVFVVKFLIQVVIDIPDIALYRQVYERAEQSSVESGTELE